jgi:tRNA pseudouridine synthase 10
VLQLHLADKTEFARMKADVAAKRKTYRCVVWIEKALLGPQDPRLATLNGIQNLVVAQRTPVRVLHRRSLLTRIKHIYSARAEYVNPHWIYLDVSTSAGTYVKEFCHGDRGRTVPSVGSLIGCKAEIIQLDVIGVSCIVSRMPVARRDIQRAHEMVSV